MAFYYDMKKRDIPREAAANRANNKICKAHMSICVLAITIQIRINWTNRNHFLVRITFTQSTHTLNLLKIFFNLSDHWKKKKGEFDRGRQGDPRIKYSKKHPKVFRKHANKKGLRIKETKFVV